MRYVDIFTANGLDIEHDLVDVAVRCLTAVIAVNIEDNTRIKNRI